MVAILDVVIAFAGFSLLAIAAVVTVTLAMFGIYEFMEVVGDADPNAVGGC